MDHWWIYHILLGTTEFFAKQNDDWNPVNMQLDIVFPFKFLFSPSQMVSTIFWPFPRIPGGLQHQDPLTVVSTHLDVWAEMRHLMGTPWLAGHVPMEPGMGGLIVATFSYFAFWNSRTKIFPLNSWSKHLPHCRAFSCLQGVLWYGGRWSNPPVGIWSITPCAAPRWRGCKTMPYSHHGGFQYCFAKCCWERPVWMNGRDMHFGVRSATIFLFGWFIEKTMSAIQFWQTWRIRPLDEQTWQWK